MNTNDEIYSMNLFWACIVHIKKKKKILKSGFFSVCINFNFFFFLNEEEKTKIKCVRLEPASLPSIPPSFFSFINSHVKGIDSISFFFSFIILILLILILFVEKKKRIEPFFFLIENKFAFENGCKLF